MNKYELTVVFGGKLTPAKQKSSMEKVKNQIEVFGGKVINTLDWGEKELAYPIKKFTQGYYATMSVEMDASNVKQLNDKLRVDETVLRYLLIKTDSHRAETNGKKSE